MTELQNEEEAQPTDDSPEPLPELRKPSIPKTETVRAFSCMAMAGFNSPTFFLICAAMFVVFSCSSTAVHAGLGIHHSLAWIPNQSTCKGSIAECFGGEEFEFDSEINRRILATSQYISYGALRRNTVPCSRRGASYYNCQPGAQANPYSRGCSAITRSNLFLLGFVNCCMMSILKNESETV
ncbi:unnamed protein product [Citrullus colocynthis]|uniref:Protein RALF-like 33 n=1 Tax=Citrullus colocynthis TaxID=252529 RepID=A0ABP0Y3H8_9ROSI